MTNNFYTSFDFETLKPRERRDNYRTPFQVDRDRIIHGQSFRRLQGKTQVFLTGEYDFYRTRLTHSMEVAQIGRSICNALRENDKSMKDDYYIDADLVEAVCLAHDLGNPPFGHAGERTLHDVMANYGGFEGNAQSLRLVAEMFYGRMVNKTGMKPTRAFLDGLLKYKIIYDETTKEPKSKFLYPDQAHYLDFVFAGGSWAQHIENLPQSIECQIMDWADNFAYSIDDLKDAITAGFIDSFIIKEWAQKQNGLTAEMEERLDELALSVEDRSSDRHLSLRMGDLIGGISLKPASNLMSDRSSRYRFSLKVEDGVEAEYETYRRLAFEAVFSTAKIQQLEFKADYILKKLFNGIKESYSAGARLHLLPEDWHNYIENIAPDDERCRVICDFLSGMTDAFAGRYFQRFFLPEHGSLTDLV